MSDEIEHQRLVKAIIVAFNGPNSATIDENEPVIDTTDPEVMQGFTGFINDPRGKRRG